MFSFFTKNTSPRRDEQLEKRIIALESERDSLNDALFETRNKVAEIKQERKMEEENLRHLVKIREEQLDIKYQKKELALKDKCRDDVNAVREDYQRKQEEELRRQIESTKSMYQEILGRLPDINVKLKGKV